MADLKVNTQVVHTAATGLKTINKQISDGLPTVQSAISKLDAAWDGAAATSTINKFNEIRSTFSQARYDVIDNYVNFLLQQIGEGYSQTEEANKSLADAFK